MTGILRIHELAACVALDAWADVMPPWPPDVFAVCGSLLTQSGAYVEVVRQWPPTHLAEDWVAAIRRVGTEWRQAFNSGGLPPPEAQGWWDVVRQNAHVPVVDVASHRALTEALLQLVSATDEASRGVGIATANNDLFHLEAASLLLRGVSLCKQIHASRARVLPKMRTPQTGITMRSLTGNIALVPTKDVDPCWVSAPVLPPNLDCLNLVLVPWPFQVSPAHFKPLDKAEHGLANLSSEFGLFSYSRPDEAETVTATVRAACSEATRLLGVVHGVVLPELALTEKEMIQVRALCDESNLLLVAGVSASDRNYCVVRAGMEYAQDKHHRWCLDSTQTRTYGLGARLNPTRRWWESHVPPARRAVYFLTLADWLTVSVLLCEDLARLDPVSELLRAVGPNLVIALLMDGPQLPARWPGRYATVLAEDPGSSVLTLSSLGMVELSRPPGHARSRVVGLWRDPIQGPVQLELPVGAEALALSVSRRFATEYLADGRDDRGSAGHAILSGCHPLHFPRPCP